MLNLENTPSRSLLYAAVTKVEISGKSVRYFSGMIRNGALSFPTNVFLQHLVLLLSSALI